LLRPSGAGAFACQPFFHSASSSPLVGPQAHGHSVKDIYER
jgi:hypothetical protein